MNTLVLLSSILGDASRSNHLAQHAIARVKATDPTGTVTIRDLAAEPLPYFDAATAGSLFTPAESRTAAQQAVVDLSDTLVAELQAADRVIIAVPVYNFGIPAQLKSYFDLVARAGITFRYTAEGKPEGLVTGKDVIVIIARGGVALGTPMDTITPYLQTFLGFLGMTQVTVVAAEGVKMGEAALNQALQGARADLERLLAA
ncbi:NAD(P)H-dependent oxidoreductase [Achromobacter sp. GG226]|uniref:FMN-dependent NADH-azoreductase n=1 Tax=Verticiella alkaliphila TaxID=2779529 RepID=UPI001C0D715E|nr:NAD(P)H-dependent oxidoreductase [Verticiella sp. GG226]MBU4610555.1 NAD(P)H-dependent oxidoreductase [Verticiella sp. GG226]